MGVFPTRTDQFEATCCCISFKDIVFQFCSICNRKSFKEVDSEQLSKQLHYYPVCLKEKKKKAGRIVHKKASLQTPFRLGLGKMKLY